MDEFDDTHLFYDVFWDGARLVLIGPSLRNLAAILSTGGRTLDGEALSEPPEIRVGHLVDFGFVPAARQPERFGLATQDIDLEVSVQPPHVDVFRSRRTLCTISQDNDLIWIRDWVEYHVKAHGADAVLFYDNMSRRYGAADVLATIREVKGIAAAVVVPWNVKYGPQGTAPGVDWDSFYSQAVMMEHARRRFLRDAAAMVNLDVDELIVAEDGVGLFEHLASSTSGAITYQGHWIRSRRTGGLGRSRHRHFRHLLPKEPLYLPKWTVVPARLPDAAQLGVHLIFGYEPEKVPQIVYRHFRSISTNWKFHRTGIEWRHRRRLKIDETWVRQMRAIGWAR